MADVVGLDTFIVHFEGYEDHYVLIGGAACSLWLGAQGLSFRSTRDLDVVIIVEGMNVEFVKLLWDFISDGKFASLEQATGKPQLYRFYGPETAGYPYMIELLTRRLLDLPESVHLAPMPLSDEISSLSAILLDDVYYYFVLEHREQIQGASTIPGRCLIPLKAKAWLDLTKRRDDGDTNVRMSDIRKHRNDVFRLLIAMPPAERVSLPATVQDDLALFLQAMQSDDATWAAVEASVQATSGNTLPSRSESIDLIEQIFGL